MAGLEARLTISGKDATGDAFASIKKKIDQVARTADTASRVSGNPATKVDAVANSFGNVGRAVEQAEGRINSMSRALHGVGRTVQDLGAMMATALGYKAMQAIEGGIKATATYEDALVHLKYAVNAKPEELKEAEKGGIELPKKYANITSKDVVETYSELIGALQHREEVGPNLEPAIAFKSAMQTAGKDAGPESMRNILKAADLLNQTTDPQKFQAYLDAILRVKQIEGTLLTTDQVRDFARRAGAARAQLSARFQLRRRSLLALKVAAAKALPCRKFQTFFRQGARKPPCGGQVPLEIWAAYT
jgi:hypothetical protein